MNPGLITFAQHLVNGVSLGSIYALIALGYTMVYGILQLINFAHSDVFMMGAFLGYFAAHWATAGAIPLPALLWIGAPLVAFLTLLATSAVRRSDPGGAKPADEATSFRWAVGAAALALAASTWWLWRDTPAVPLSAWILWTGRLALLGLIFVTAARSGTWPAPLTLGAIAGIGAASAALVGAAGSAGEGSLGLYTAQLVTSSLIVAFLVQRQGRALVVAVISVAVILGACAHLYPLMARMARTMAFGAIRVPQAGTVTQVKKLVIKPIPTLTVGGAHTRLAAADSVTVAEGATVAVGDVVSALGFKSLHAGKVDSVKIERERVREVMVGDVTVAIPLTHQVAVEKGQTLAAGDAVSTGIVWGTPIMVMLFAMVGASTLGFVIERTAYRPLRKAPRINSLITAMGISLLLENSAQLVFGADPKAFPDIIPDIPPLVLSGVRVDVNQITVLLCSVLLMAVLQYVVHHTRLGLAMRAVSFNHDCAALMGVPVDRIIASTFVIGSSLAAAAGILVGVMYTRIDPMMGMLLGLKAFVAAVLGGIGNIPGALLGGMLMGLSEEMVVGYISSSYRDAIAFLILIVILLFRPAGLLGQARTEKV